MNAFIDFIMGPMVWISFLIFLGGLGYKLYRIIHEVRTKEGYVFSYLTWYHSLRSIGAWLIPFYPRATRQQPFFYGASYIFHLALFVVPLFLSAHIVLVEEAFNVSWPALNDTFADLLTVVIIASLAFFTGRRLIQPEVKFLTTAQDFALLFIVLIPFLTGFLAYHQVFAYQWMMILHILSGEFMLIIIPFSRFSHMITAALTRAYTGSEFGNVRHARDW
ncbi:MAG TPA: nitrate reductase [Desulfobacteraceae bacterium]|nr:nitrate reductase [Desulfobacteraceae bacterium]|tara:strand:+ start:171 stop:830 length:660 start_codon:yes stop_codon:yes gene_type:complete